jgi:hypothetical protein
MKNEILISNNLIQVKAPADASVKADVALVGTLIANFVSYGYALSESVIKNLQSYSASELKEFWKSVKPALDEITGKNRNMEAFVVYKNFPEEVLAKSDAEYWFAQIFMYLGVKNEHFTEEVKPRDPLFEKVSLKVLSIAKDNALDIILAGYISNTSRWSDNQTKYAAWLFENVKVKDVNLSSFGFQMNGIASIKQAIELGIPVHIADATDVLRLAAALSDADMSLRTNVRFKNFKKSERKILLGVLENTKNLESDMAMRKTLWKKFLARLHPGDFEFKRVKEAYNSLYNNTVKSFNSEIESAINGIQSRTAMAPQITLQDLDKNKSYSLNDLKKVVEVIKPTKKALIVLPEDANMLKALSARPGDMLRRFHKLYSLFGNKTVAAMESVVNSLTTTQLLKFKKYIETINDRKQLMIAPKGNWTKAQVIENNKVKVSDEDKTSLLKAIGSELSNRMEVVFPEGVKLSERTKDIKLQTNDQELAEYGRGTVFDIPENIKFFRSASYWKQISYGNTWFDNGWNFFNEDWKALGTCCWNVHSFGHKAAIFSGDPTNSKDMEGRACQMIDLYLDKLQAEGVRYAVWNVLAFSRISFSEAEDVLATLQMGEEPMEGGLYEPSRAQMVFPLKGDNMTKYIAYIDVKERKLVYMDANLNGNVQSAHSNEGILADKMPAFMEYLETLPSVYDLVSYAKEGSVPVVYSDKEMEIKEGKAYVFKPENTANEFEKIDINSLLS